MIEFDTVGTITWANQPFLTLMGYDLDALVGSQHRKLCLPEYVASADYVQHWVKLRRGRYEQGQFERVRADGRRIWLQATYNPIFGADGKVRRVLKVATDVTAKIVLERALKSSQSAMQETMHELGSIVSDISGLAEQSKLLSLNASIEAARAGDSGRGFVVVAAEVKKLSDDTKTATERAAKMLGRHAGSLGPVLQD